MKRTILALFCLAGAGYLSAQQTPLYLMFNASCMDQLEYRYVYIGNTVMAYSIRPTANEQFILTAGSGGISSPTLPKGTVNCREYALNEQFLNEVNSLTRQVYVVHQLSKGYQLVPVISATQVTRSGSYYLFRAPSYSFAVDTTNLVYESNIATGSSSWYIYFNGLKIRSCYYEYSFKREPTKVGQERSEFDFIPGIGMLSERTGMSAAEAENNHMRLVKVNGSALEDFISLRCQGKTAVAAPPASAPLSTWSPPVNYGGAVRESDKETASLQQKTPIGPMLPPPLANCPEQPGEGYHIVQPGETLNAISRAYEIPVKSLITWNKIKDPDKIKVCQKVWLRKPPATAPVVATTTSKGNAPAAYSTATPEVQAIRQDKYWQQNAAAAPAAYSTTTPQPVYAAEPKTLVHTVQKGETLYGIGQRYNVSESDMRRFNQFPASGEVVLKPGMQLFVADCCPTQNTTGAAAPEAPKVISTHPGLGGQPAATQPQPATTIQPAGGGGVLPELYTVPTTTQPTPVPATQPAATTTAPAPAANQTKPPAYFQEYVVREGDTINSIAIKFKVNPQELALVNNKEPNETLIAGQRLLIPRN